MARFLYALSGQGRGHLSRALALAETLRARGHRVGFAASGLAERHLAARGETVLPVPPLRQVLAGNRVDLAATVRANAATVLAAPARVAALADAFAHAAPDLVVSDFEAFSVRAARRLGLPVVAVNHQQVLTETALDVPKAQRRAAFWVKLPVRAIAPASVDHVVVSSFFEAPVRRPDRVTLVGPILRRAVLDARPTDGAFLLAYTNDPTLAAPLAAALARAGQPARLYGAPEDLALPHGVEAGPAGDDEAFLADLAACRGVVSTAGHTLLSEALHLGKPVLALPNGGLYEQTLNAHMLARLGGGVALERPVPHPSDVAAFVGRLARLRDAPALPPGNAAAADVLEAALARAARPAWPHVSPGLAPLPIAVS